MEVDADIDDTAQNLSPMPPPLIAPQARGPRMGPPQAAPQSPKPVQPKVVTLDQKVKEQKIAEKKAKYKEVIESLKYVPPPTAASVPDSRYSFEVLKGGAIVDSIKFSNLEGKGFYIVGRVPACDVVAENPTVSRMHAIFQFIKGTGISEDNNEKEDDGQEIPTTQGLYIYDLDSSHGTFINKNQIFPKRYYRLKVGHVVKFGNSTRLYILDGPSDDQEEESEKTVTELQNEKLQKELARKKLEAQGVTVEVKEEDDGCGWGMAEDAEEETDLRENPFAINFEESESFDNPKKTLKSWFDREGFDLVYDCREKAPGQFICKINLPIDGPGGQAVFAEVDLKGKKKETVAQAALQACQILDKYGVLRQSNQESRSQLKKKNWEEQDYYSSDEDTFLDRTGNVEKKRQARMKIAGKLEETVETYESLCEKSEKIQEEINSLQIQLQNAQKLNSMKSEDDVDLDDYMNNLKSGATDIKQLKIKLREKSEELKRISKLQDIAKPANLPAKLTVPIKTEVKDEVDSKTETNPAKKISGPDSDPPKTEKSPKSPEETKEPPPDLEHKKHTPDVNPKFKLFGPRVGPAKSSFKPPLSKSIQEAVTVLIDKEEEEKDDSEDEIAAVDSIKATETNQPAQKEVKEDGSSSENNDDEECEGLDTVADSADPEINRRKRKTKPRHRQPRPKVKKDNTNFGAYDAADPKYDVWVPPSNQEGDGRTSLNDKLGY